MGVKKNKLERKTKIFKRRVKLNWKIALTKGKTNQKNESQIKKIKQHKLWLKNEIESQ
jgi:uncharacterized protein YdcH (DUF465 family)